MFAKWWSLQQTPRRSPGVEKAINGRFIMNNDLSRITPETKLLPYCIWYPSVPHPATCRELLRRVPSMKPAIARVCILADYPEVWDILDADPDDNLMIDAWQSHNPRYLRDLKSTIESRGCRKCPQGYASDLRSVPRYEMFEYTSIGPVIPNVIDTPCSDVDVDVPYNGRPASMAQIELTVALSDEIRNLAKELWDREYTAVHFDDKYYTSSG